MNYQKNRSIRHESVESSRETRETRETAFAFRVESPGDPGAPHCQTLGMDLIKLMVVEMAGWSGRAEQFHDLGRALPVRLECGFRHELDPVNL